MDFFICDKVVNSTTLMTFAVLVVIKENVEQKSKYSEDIKVGYLEVGTR